MTEECGPPEIPRRFGAYRRAIRIASTTGTVTGEMEDDVHHFRVELQHDGAVLRKVTCETLRTPYTTCAGALGPLTAREGRTLNDVVHTGLRIADVSIIPVMPTANTNAPVIMVAEKAADLIKHESKVRGA